MAKCRSINYFYLIPGILISAIIIFLFFLFFTYLFKTNNLIYFYSLTNIELFKIINFSFFQAILSTLFSIIPSIFIAISLYRRSFWVNIFIINICNLTLIIPVLVAIMGIINIYGNDGWLSKIFNLIGINYYFPIYGITGILITHLFFNIPLSVIILINQLKLIPIEQLYLAEQLQISNWNKFLLIEWKQLKEKITSLIILIFILCFSSFTTIFTLGGGPKNTNMEVAIFYLFNYDANFELAGILSIVKIFICFLLTLFVNFFNQNYINTRSKKTKYFYERKNDNFFIYFIDYIIITIFFLFIFLPIISLFYEGLNSTIKNILFDKIFWISVKNSLLISFFSSLLSIIISLFIILSIRELFFNKFKKTSFFIETICTLFFSIPTITLSTSIFIMLNSFNIELNNNFKFFLIIFVNAFIILPFNIKILKNDFFYIVEKYDNLILSLNIKKWQKFKLIELKILKKSLSSALCVSFILSIGDISNISILNNQNIFTLPFYLYEQINNYQYNKASFVSLFLLFLCLIINIASNKISKNL